LAGNRAVGILNVADRLLEMVRGHPFTCRAKQKRKDRVEAEGARRQT
jgi:hypothetical protein